MVVRTIHVTAVTVGVICTTVDVALMHVAMDRMSMDSMMRTMVSAPIAPMIRHCRVVVDQQQRQKTQDW